MLVMHVAYDAEKLISAVRELSSEINGMTNWK
jgi:hypothetical protein